MAKETKERSGGNQAQSGAPRICPSCGAEVTAKDLEKLICPRCGNGLPPHMG